MKSLLLGSTPEQITTLEKGSIRITSANKPNRDRRKSMVGETDTTNLNYILDNGISAFKSSPINSVRGSLDSTDSFDTKIVKEEQNKPNNLERFKRSFSNTKISSPKNKEIIRNEHITEARFIDGENSYISEKTHSNKSINITVRKNSLHDDGEKIMEQASSVKQNLDSTSKFFFENPMSNGMFYVAEGGGKENNIELPKIHSLKTHQVASLPENFDQSIDIFPIIDNVNSENEENPISNMLCPACSILFSVKSSPSPINMLSDKQSSKNGVTLSERRTSLLYANKKRTPPSSFIVDKKTKISAKVPSPEERKVLLLVSIQEGLNELQDHSIIMFEEIKKINFNVNLLTSKVIQLNNIIGNLQ